MVPSHIYSFRLPLTLRARLELLQALHHYTKLSQILVRALEVGVTELEKQARGEK